MGKIAFVFAGQGAQFVGMGRDLYDNFESAKNLFDTAEENLKNITFFGPAEKLNETINAQVALFLVGLACAKILTENGIKADGAAGFSLGEIPSLAYCGLLSEKEAFDLVMFRAEIMRECSRKYKGGMFAVLKLPSDKVEEICREFDNAYPVNYNCINQTVVACGEDTYEDIQKSVVKNGGKTIKLSVSGAFHSPFMDEAAEKMEEYLKNINFKEMKLPLYSNKTAKIYDNPKNLVARQINSPVLWQKTIENMISDGFDIFIEVGAGKTLSNLISKINGEVKVFSVENITTLKETLAEVTNVKR